MAQIEKQRIQMILYSEELSAREALILPDSDVISDIQLIDLDRGLGVEFQLPEVENFRAGAYLDVNRRDILLALTRMDQELILPVSPPLFTIVPVPETPSGPIAQPAEEDDEPARTIHFPEMEMDNSPDSSRRLRVQRKIFPGDPLEFYLRWAGEGEQHARIGHHIHYSGSAASRHAALDNQTHPWSRQQIFSKSSTESDSDLMIFDPVLFTSYNSDYPVGGNDGALWQGRGFNTAITMGIGYQYDFLEVVFRPIFVSSDNRDFALSRTVPYEGLSEFAMAQTYSDIPQRFGFDSVNRFDLGESYLKASYEGWTAGLSNERFRTGPAIYNPLIFGYNAPGFFHFFAGTDSPLEMAGGQFETRIFWGGLRDSGFFLDEAAETTLPDSRYITGFTINYNPDFLTGLHAGFTRTAVSYFPENGFGLSEFFMAFRRSPEKLYDISPYDAWFIKSSFFVRWHFPESGFEAYAEWGRNDNRRTLRDVLMEPELNRGYVLGFLKRFRAGTHRRFVINGEITNLENSSVTAQSRDFNIWYTHPVIQQGFTHRGQVIGAPIGPGSSTQRINFSYYDHFGMLGFSLGRIAYHNDRLFKNFDFYEQSLARPWMTLRMIQETEMFGSLHGLVFIPGGFEFRMDLRYGIIENRNNQHDITREGGMNQAVFFDEPNVNISFTLRYSLQNLSR